MVVVLLVLVVVEVVVSCSDGNNSRRRPPPPPAAARVVMTMETGNRNLRSKDQNPGNICKGRLQSYSHHKAELCVEKKGASTSIDASTLLRLLGLEEFGLLFLARSAKLEHC